MGGNTKPLVSEEASLIGLGAWLESDEARHVPQDEWERAMRRFQELRRKLRPKPANCTCSYPDFPARSFSRHGPECPVDAEFRAAMERAQTGGTTP